MGQCCKGKRKTNPMVVKPMIWEKKENEEIYDEKIDNSFVELEDTHIDNNPIETFEGQSIINVSQIIGLINNLRRNMVSETEISNKINILKGVTRVSFGGNPAYITSITYNGEIVKLT